MTQNLTQKNAQSNSGYFLYKKESYLIRGACFEVYKQLGYGHKEKIYQRALKEEFQRRNLYFTREAKINVFFAGTKVGIYVPDFLVEKKIIVEVKAKIILTNQDIKQFWQYLRGSTYKVGFLVNFGKPGGVEIVRRIYDRARKEILRNSA